MAELSISRQNTNRDDVATRTKKAIYNAQQLKIDLANQQKQKELDKKIEDKKNEGKEKKGAKAGTVKDAVELATANADETKEKKKFENQKIEDNPNPYLTKSQNQTLQPGKKKQEEEIKDNKNRERGFRQNLYRNNARENIADNFQNEDYRDLENYPYIDRLDKIEKIISEISKLGYGTVTREDAEKILDRKIEGTQTWGQIIIDWTLEIALWLYSISTNIAIFAIATTTGLITAGLGTATSFGLGIFNVFFIFVLNLIVRVGLALWRLHKSRTSFTNINEIKSLQDILRKHTARINRLYIYISENIPFVNILPIAQIGHFLDNRFRKKLLRVIKNAKR